MSAVAQVKPPRGWRLKLGAILVALSLGSAVFIPIVAALPLSTEMKATISGLLVFGIPQLLMVVAVAIVGKSGFAYIKTRLFGTLKGQAAKLAPPRTVSRARYWVGLVMFGLPILAALIGPYLDELFPGRIPLVFGPLLDLVFLASFLVLGGDFWDKLKALFIYDAKVALPNA